MAVYSVQTKLDEQEAIQKASAFFGEGGLGLKASKENECCVTFTGGGGHVTVSAVSEDSGHVTVELETREWDYQVKQFMREIT